MQTKIHSRYWDTLSREQVLRKFDELPETTVMPYGIMIEELCNLKAATIELLENGPDHTTYRIRETGKIYLLRKTGMAKVFSFENYKPKIENFVTYYENKPPVFTISKEDEDYFIKRYKNPAFKAQYNHQTKEITKVSWEGEEPLQTAAINSLKKAAFFLKNI